MKLQGTIKLTGQIVVKTGLHIGAGNDKVEIGGVDNPIIRDPFSNKPYIPGSSLKGKMRSLIEWASDAIGPEGKPCEDKNSPVCVVFGTGSTKNDSGKSENIGPTRLIVRDSLLLEDDKELKDDKNLSFKREKPIIEEKSENSINRITAEANPRFLERVVPGVKFNLEIIYRIFNENDKKHFNSIVLESLMLLENDYLGGGGSRGNGRVQFENLILSETLDGKTQKKEATTIKNLKEQYETI